MGLLQSNLRLLLGVHDRRRACQLSITAEGDWLVAHIVQKRRVHDPCCRCHAARRAVRPSQRKRMLVEEEFGWLKTVAGMAEGQGPRTAARAFPLPLACNLIRMPGCWPRRRDKGSKGEDIDTVARASAPYWRSLPDHEDLMQTQRNRPLMETHSAKRRS